MSLPKSLLVVLLALVTIGQVYGDCGDNPAANVDFTDGTGTEEPYGDDLSCVWEISTNDEETQPVFSFSRVDLVSSDNHKLEFFRNHGSDNLPEFPDFLLNGKMAGQLGSQILQHRVFVAQKDATVKFTTSGSSQGRTGFTAKWEPQQRPPFGDCGGEETALEPEVPVTITDGSDENANYEVGRRCKWTFTWDIGSDPETPEPAELTFDILDFTEQQDQHYLAIYDGDEYEEDVILFSGADTQEFLDIYLPGEDDEGNPPDFVDAFSGKVTIVWQAADTGATVDGKGFKMNVKFQGEYIPAPEPDCQYGIQVELEEEGTLTHPNPEDRGKEGGHDQTNKFCRINVGTSALDDTLELTVQSLDLFDSDDLELVVFKGDPNDNDDDEFDDGDAPEDRRFRRTLWRRKLHSRRRRLDDRERHVLFRVKGSDKNKQDELIGETFSIPNATSLIELQSSNEGEVSASEFVFKIGVIDGDDHERPDDYYDDYFPDCQERDIEHGSKTITDGSEENEPYESDIDCSWIHTTEETDGEDPKHTLFTIIRLDLRNSPDHVLSFYEGGTADANGLVESITGEDYHANPELYEGYTIHVELREAGVWFNTSGSSEGHTGFAVTSELVEAEYRDDDDYVVPTQSPPEPDDDYEPPEPEDDPHDDGGDDGDDWYDDDEDDGDDWYDDDGDDWYDDDGDDWYDDDGDDWYDDDDDQETDCIGGKTCTTLSGTDQLDEVATIINDIAIQINKNRRATSELREMVDDMRAMLNLFISENSR